MSDVLQLLKSKNRCLKRFLRLSEEFLGAAADGSDAWMNLLGLFESRRDAAIRNIELHDRKIAQAVDAMPAGERAPELVEAVRAELAAREALVREIVAVDLKIMAGIEEARSRLMREMAGSRVARDRLARFKSTWVPESGEGLDEKL
jgi:hypothetical protein